MARDEDRVKPGGDAAEAIKECDAFEEEVAALKTAYDQFFMGLEKKPPLRAHEELKKRLDKFRARPHRLVAVKFRIGALHQKFQTYERLWERTLKEIENGTFKRDVMRARKRLAPPEQKRRSAPETLEADGGSLEEAMAAASASVDRRSTLPSVPPLSGLPKVPSVPVLTPAGGLPKVPSVQGLPSVPGLAGLPKPAAPAGIAPLANPGGLPRVPSVQGLPSVPAPGGLPRPIAPAAIPPLANPGGLPRVPSVQGLPRPIAPAAIPPLASPGGLPRVPSPAATAAPRPPAPVGGGGSDLSDARMRAVYDAYVAAKKQGGEDTSKLSYDAVAQTLRKQVPELLAKTKAKSVDFKVEIKDGKAQLKAVPKG